MAGRTDIFDLGRLGLSSGEGWHLDLTVGIGPFEFGGERYEVLPSDVPAQLDVSRTTGNGWFVRLRLDAQLSGPCMRCLEDAGRSIAIDVREVDQPGSDDDELQSPYIDGDELDLRALARDALVLELPTQIVCSDECKGLCS
ncbi:MAG: YceD family protein, partial [Gaiellaceae bacterium]